MENDIDDLLDEVEQKYVKKTTPSRNVKASPTAKSRVKPAGSGLDAAIDDILDIDLPASHTANAFQSTSKNSTLSTSGNSQSKSEQKRCFPVYLGGSGETMGRGASMNKHACDQLRCTSCDFRICHFENMAWSRDTDYLFLRNNAPDFQKLKGKLSRKKGCRAYCCQCQWRNVLEICELRDPQLKWVCGKHPS
ncbi:protein C8orf37 homolog isoform X3 [Aplysia californica]|uniref:Cilia- and flagella-associated protein 418 n=1 Tax=Aplysia californica TaxID=6500 RepID=A0ABM1VPJ8_APLCA|nr:protein C8orf37 homolog isoform X3 [Aplysia californica]XP_012935144.1 protein C8orf37 homolog isoform X3 [Aplysia californica]XP_035824340.1 protein C8orf37 homolog isoform X3 [Aplysia californica]